MGRLFERPGVAAVGCEHTVVVVGGGGHQN